MTESHASCQRCGVELPVRELRSSEQGRVLCRECAPGLFVGEAEKDGERPRRRLSSLLFTVAAFAPAAFVLLWIVALAIGRYGHGHTLFHIRIALAWLGFSCLALIPLLIAGGAVVRRRETHCDCLPSSRFQFSLTTLIVLVLTVGAFLGLNVTARSGTENPIFGSSFACQYRGFPVAFWRRAVTSDLVEWCWEGLLFDAILAFVLLQVLGFILLRRDRRRFKQLSADKTR